MIGALVAYGMRACHSVVVNASLPASFFSFCLVSHLYLLFVPGLLPTTAMQLLAVVYKEY